MTDYAEGELFQVLEDDGCLPEEQVSLHSIINLVPRAFSADSNSKLQLFGRRLSSP